MKSPIFTGSATAIITPFNRETVDFPALGRLIERQIAGHTDAIVVCGTTGEAATMSYVERMRTIEYTVRQVDHRVPVIAGTGANNTENAITLSKDAALAGVDGLLVVTPFYNKATQAGLVRHYTTIADAVDRPMILYNVPSRTGVCASAETYLTLAKHPNIAGVKEASGDFTLIQDTLSRCPETFSVWSGNDEDTAAICMLGGKGVISVAANIVPQEMHDLAAACLRNDYRLAGQMQLRLFPLCRALFCEVNPIPVKTALAMMGCCEERLRLPLCEMEPANRCRLQEILQEYGLL